MEASPKNESTGENRLTLARPELLVRLDVHPKAQVLAIGTVRLPANRCYLYPA